MNNNIHENDTQRVKILSEALPYIQEFRGRAVVVKYGGAAMNNSDIKDTVMRDIVFLSCVGVRPVIVHGGGPEINSWLDKLGIEPQFKDGLRVTDADTMDVVEMVLVGRVNKEIVALINQAGGKAVGLCGKDGGRELVTVIVGEGAASADVEAVVAHVRAAGLEVEVHDGGQPLYPFLFGAE